MKNCLIALKLNPPLGFQFLNTRTNKIAENLGLTSQKEQSVLADGGDKDVGDIPFKVIVDQKTVF